MTASESGTFFVYHPSIMLHVVLVVKWGTFFFLLMIDLFHIFTLTGAYIIYVICPSNNFFHKHIFFIETILLELIWTTKFFEFLCVSWWLTYHFILMNTNIGPRKVTCSFHIRFLRLNDSTNLLCPWFLAKRPHSHVILGLWSNCSGWLRVP